MKLCPLDFCREVGQADGSGEVLVKTELTFQMPRDDFQYRAPENVPGRFYVSDECLDCDQCRVLAPVIFVRHDPGGYSFVRKQPDTPEEIALAKQCAAGCCVDAIHDDGDSFDWQAIPAGSRPQGGPPRVIPWPPQSSVVVGGVRIGLSGSMKTTRICVGLAVWFFVMGPFLMLGKLSLDIRGYGLLTRFHNADIKLPELSEWLWRFGPVGWWAYLTPVALALAVAAVLRKPLQWRWLAGLLAGAMLQFVALFAAVLIYYKMTSVMGYPMSVPIPMENLACNISLLGTSMGLAAWSVARMWKSRAPSFQRNDS